MKGIAVFVVSLMLLGANPAQASDNWAIFGLGALTGFIIGHHGHTHYSHHHRYGWIETGSYNDRYAREAYYSRVYVRPQPQVVYVQPQVVYIQPQPTVVYSQPAPVVQRSKKYCREYLQDVTIGGETVKGYGTVCRNIDGSWTRGPLKLPR